MKVLGDFDFNGKRVIVRADLDVEVGGGAGANSPTRLLNLKPTIDYLLGHGASRITIIGHIDRPERWDPKLSTKQILEHLKKILGQEVVFQESFEDIVVGKVVLFENLRFWPGERMNDLEFAQKLAQLGNIYVNDAFGNCHRLHASMVLLPTLLPHCAGEHLKREVGELNHILLEPARPFIAVVGGAKLETKIPVISHLSKFADNVLVGGQLPEEIARKGINFMPNVMVGTLTPDKKDLDAATILEFTTVLRFVKTVVWNGPLGEFESGHMAGSLAVSKAIIEAGPKANRAVVGGEGVYSIVGGGETSQFLAQNNLLDRFSFVSAGGGAMLEFLAGRELPGVKALG